MSIIQEALNKVKRMPLDIGYNNQREKRSNMSLPFLFVVLLAAAALYFFRDAFPGIKPAAIKSKEAVPVAAPQAAPSAPVNIPAPLQIQANTVVIKNTDPEFIFSGVMFLEDGPRAIINGSVLEEGDTIGGARVERIEREKVFLKYKNEEITLNLM